MRIKTNVFLYFYSRKKNHNNKRSSRFDDCIFGRRILKNKNKDSRHITLCQITHKITHIDVYTR